MFTKILNIHSMKQYMESNKMTKTQKIISTLTTTTTNEPTKKKRQLKTTLEQDQQSAGLSHFKTAVRYE